MPEVIAVVLAAGRGTRMGEITRTIPKPLMPVGGVPAVARVLRGLHKSGIAHAVVVVGYLGHKVRAALTEDVVPGLRLTFVEQTEQLGTGHALRLTQQEAGDGPVLLCFADIMTSPENYGKMLRDFFEFEADVIAAVRMVDDPFRAAAVYTDDEGNITRIIEKPPQGTSTTRQSHAGIYCFSNRIFDYLESLTPSARGEYEVTDAVAAMVRDGRLCRITALDGYWKDLATPVDVEEAEALIKEDEKLSRS